MRWSRRDAAVSLTLVLRYAQGESKNLQRQRQRKKQIPFGDDNQKNNGKHNDKNNGKNNGKGNDKNNGKGNDKNNGKDNGKGNGKNNGKGEIQGSLHCATDGEAVRCFGRDDVPFVFAGDVALGSWLRMTRFWG
jgi:hypothetical protein